MTPSVSRALNAILFLIHEAREQGKRVTQYDIVKSLFLADRAHLNKYGRPVTFDNYVAMKDGPVPSFSYDLAKGAAGALRQAGLSGTPWRREPAPEHGPRAFHYLDPVFAVDENVLSESDFEELRNALIVVKTLGFHQIRKLTHEDRAYLDAWEDNGGSARYPMSYALLLDEQNDKLAQELAFLSKHI